MSQHWNQVASKANIRWVKKQILDQKTDILSLRRLTSYALINRGISKEKLLDYLEALEALGYITVNCDKQVIHKLQLELETFESPSKI